MTQCAGFVLAVALVSSLGATSIFAQAEPAPKPLPRLMTKGQATVDAAGNPVVLKGVNLGNWLLIEPGVFPRKQAEVRDAYSLKRIFIERFGEEGKEKLMRAWHENFITAGDFERVKAFDMNFVRLGFEYDVMEAAPFKLREDAFKYLDFAVDQCERNGLYILIDLHGAPERQGPDKPTGRIGYNKFWKDPVAQDRAMFLWKAIIERYKGRTNVFAYEALNEPWGGKKEELRAFCDRWYKELRPLDPDVIMVFPGWTGDIKFLGSPKDNGWSNAMYDMHFYPGIFSGKAAAATHRDFINNSLRNGWTKQMRDYDSPLLVGEINVVYKAVGGGEMTRNYVDFFSEQGWATCIWTIKEYGAEGGVGERAWGITTNAKPMKMPTFATASFEDILAYFESLSKIETAIDRDLQHWLTTKEKPRSPEELVKILPATTAPSSASAPAGQ